MQAQITQSSIIMNKRTQFQLISTHNNSKLLQERLPINNLSSQYLEASHETQMRIEIKSLSNNLSSIRVNPCV